MISNIRTVPVPRWVTEHMQVPFFVTQGRYSILLTFGTCIYSVTHFPVGVNDAKPLRTKRLVHDIKKTTSAVKIVVS